MLQRFKIGLALSVSTLLGMAAYAQWATQTITLDPGWNAVFLEVQPEPAACEVLFAGIPVESVWAWNRRFSTVQYIQDPNSLIPGEPDWLVYLPNTNPNRAVGNLFTLVANQAYLVKMPAAGAPVTWTITGRPGVRPLEWLPGSLNLVGFAVDPANPPTFQSLLSGSPAHAGSAVYQLNSTGAWAPVAATTVKAASGRAYWVYCNGASTYSGPVAAAVEQGRGLDYDRIIPEQTIRLRNNYGSSRTISLSPLASAVPPSTQAPLLAGAVPLSYWNGTDFVPLSSSISKVIAPGAEWAIRLAVRRPDMAAYTPPAGRTDVLYQSVLQVSDGAGTRLRVPVTAKGMQPVASQIGLLGDGLGESPMAGLWVGTALIAKVNQPSSLSDPALPRDTASQFQFRLLLHVDTAGQPRLLQQVLLMWTNGVRAMNTDGYLEMVSPGRQVLLTDDSLVSAYSGATMRDGQAVARRFSSAAFGFRNPLPMTLAAGGPVGSDGSTYTVNVTLDYDDPSNPFKHRYHPDHNNLNERFDQNLPQGVESFTVNRLITLRFTASDPENLKLAGWGDSQIGGTYKEAITGLIKNTVYLEGVFRLSRACQVGSLNGAL